MRKMATHRGWWSYMKYIVRKYGSVKEPKAELERRELEAVRRAVDETFRTRDGKSRIELIEMCYWRRSHNIAGAAMVLGVSERTALRWHGEFIKTVAAEFFGDMSLKPQHRDRKKEEKENVG